MLGSKARTLLGPKARILLALCGCGSCGAWSHWSGIRKPSAIAEFADYVTVDRGQEEWRREREGSRTHHKLARTLASYDIPRRALAIASYFKNYCYIALHFLFKLISMLVL